jgi:hypothetical protein
MSGLSSKANLRGCLACTPDSSASRRPLANDPLRQPSERITPTTRPRICTSRAEDRLHLRRSRAAANVVGLAEIALHGRLLADERDDDVAVRACSCECTTTRSPSMIAASRIDSPRTRSRKVPSSPPAAERHRDVVLDVLLGEHRLTGGDCADQRQARRHPPMPACSAIAQLERARLRRIAAQQPICSRFARCW